MDSSAETGKTGIFFADAKPDTLDAGGKAELGLKFYVEKTGKIKSFLLYQAKSESGPHSFRLWSTDGKLIMTLNAPAVQKAGWICVPLPEYFTAVASTEYILSYTCNSNYVATVNGFSSPVSKDGIMATAGLFSFTDVGQKAPDKTFKDMNYFIDIEFELE